MSANILTPNMLWKSFSLDKQPKIDIVLSKQKTDVTIEHFYVDGRTTKTGVVKTYVVSARPIAREDLPVLIVFTDGRNMSEENIATAIARDGYYAFVINLYGKKQNKERFTIYPNDIEYANYETAKNNLYAVKKDVKHTCWYEWSSASKYAVSAIKNKVGARKIGIIGVKEFATASWQVVAFDKDISAYASLFGFGWNAYKGLHKFGDKLEPQFNDETLMFVAGIESESYAMHVKCPTMIVTSTNSTEYNVDRAYDTIAKIKDDIFKAVDFSVNYTSSLDNDASINLKKFFDCNLKGSDDCLSSAKAEIRAEIKSGLIEVEISPETSSVKEVCLYASEEVVNPAKRCWTKFSPKKIEDNKFVFEYLPYPKSKIAFFFARVTTENGFTFSTSIIAKKFSEKEIGVSHKSTVIYSGRQAFSESVFSPLTVDGLIAEKSEEVTVKNGPMSIAGVGAANGLKTFKINCAKDKPREDAIFMFDVFSKEENEVTVKFIDSNDNEYFNTTAINGGKVWFNLKFDRLRFKTKEGMILKSYDKIIRMEITYSKPCLINNALWV